MSRAWSRVCAALSVVLAPALSAAAPAARPDESSTRVIVKVRTDRPAAGTLFARYGVRAARPLHPGREKARSLSVLTDAQLTARTRERFAPRTPRIPAGATVPDLAGTYVLDLGRRSAADVDSVLAAMRRDPAVAYAERDGRITASFVPNDPRWSAFGSWGQSFDDLWGLKKIASSQAWDGARGQGVLVAVVDTGIDHDHPDIDENVWINAGEIDGNGVDDDGNGFVDDRRGWDFIGTTVDFPRSDNDPFDGQGHGTHVAGTVAAEGDNGIGVIGVAWKARVMAVKALDDRGTGEHSTVAEAIVYAADNGADVINLSLGAPTPGGNQTLADAVRYAHGLGVVIVASAGNDNTDWNGIHIPSDYAESISVAATGPSDERATFSNLGATIDVAAPGVDVLSLAKGTADYVPKKGTSMAAPHVSGVAALILERHPEFTNEQVRQALRASAVDLGTPGRDDLFGHGRISAGRAVLVDEALDVHITSPVTGANVTDAVSVIGTVQGPTFARYVVEFGVGAPPSAWTTARESTTPVVAGELAVIPLLDDGSYTIRVRAFTQGGLEFSDQVLVKARYVEFMEPRTPALPAHTEVYRSGSPLRMVGRAAGPGFQSFRVEWARGRDATAGWSSVGMALTSNGTVSVVDAELGFWTPPAGLLGEHTMRLSVVNAAGTTRKTLTVYLEPDLISTTYPASVGPGTGGRPAMAARRHDGRTALVVCGFDRFPGCTFILDSLARAFSPLQVGSPWPPAVGDVDASLPGEEVVVADGRTLKIFAADGRAIRQYSAGPMETFGSDVTSLVDLDADGLPEILSIARSTSGAARLHVVKANLTPFNPRFPLALVSPLTPAASKQASVVVTDLEGDLRKEIVAAVVDANGTQYTLLAWNADGTPRAGWSSPSFPATALEQPLAAVDLDRDGRIEIVVAEKGASSSTLRLVGSDGVTRPGWPVTVARTDFAIGDLDPTDGGDDIVGSAASGGIVILRPDGTSRDVTWPMESAAGPPILADVDGDGRVEIVTVYSLRSETNGTPWRDTRLRALRPSGTVVKEWRLFGSSLQQPFDGRVTAFDFGVDRKTDLAVNLRFAVPGSIDTPSSQGELSVFTTNAPAAAGSWPSPYRDVRQSRWSPAAPRLTTVRVNPVADAYVRDGTSASTNFGTATTLAVKNSSTAGTRRTTHLRFPLSTANGKIASATLRLFGSRPGAHAAADLAFPIRVDTWSETGITWNNQPISTDEPASATVIGTTAQYYEWDVSAFVRERQMTGGSAGSVVSFAIGMDTPTTDGPDTFNSREAASNRPELVMQVAPDGPPVILTPAAASPATVTWKTTQLSVRADDDGGEPFLIYTWSTVGTPPAPVTFSANGTNAAKNTTVTFTKVGTYNFQATVRDARGQTATSSTSASVVSSPNGTLTITPANATVAPGGTLTFTATAVDQFGTPMGPVNAFWAVDGGGSINTAGVFTAGSETGGPFTVFASSGNATGTAEVSVSVSSTVTLGAVADAYVRDGTSAGTNFGTASSLVVKSTSSAGNNRIAYLRFGLAGVNGGVVSARLRVFGRRPAATAATDSAFAVASNTWTETGLTWNNRPVLGARQGAPVTITTTAQYYEFDVTAFVRAQRGAGAAAASLALRMDATVSDAPDAFNSREATASRPELIVAFDPSDTTTVTTLAPAADAYVRDGTSAATNFGAAANLDVKSTSSAGNNRVTYLRFPLTGVGSDVLSARLRLYGRRPTAHAATLSAHEVADLAWTESGLTWNNRPPLGARQGTGLVVSTTAQYHELDVTAWVRAQKAAGAAAVSLALQMDALVTEGPDTFNSKEAAGNRPELVVNSRP